MSFQGLNKAFLSCNAQLVNDALALVKEGIATPGLAVKTVYISRIFCKRHQHAEDAFDVQKG
jgi:hypothetical protein